MTELELVVAYCTRGLCHSRSVESVQWAMQRAGFTLAQQGDTWDWLFTHDLPIPDAQNDVTTRALALGASAVWYVEEDIRVPDVAAVQLLEILRAGGQMIVADYPMKGGCPAVALSPQGRVLYSGIGCAVVRRDVLDRIGPPWFETEWNYHFFETDAGTVHVERGAARTLGYGGLDVDFFAKAHQCGYQAVVAPFDCGHLFVVKPGKPKQNDGCHQIVEKRLAARRQTV